MNETVLGARAHVPRCAVRRRLMSAVLIRSARARASDASFRGESSNRRTNDTDRSVYALCTLSLSASLSPVR
jgi:hypothetical protein